MSDVRELLARPVDPDEYDAIRELWTQHSKAEDQRDIAGLLAVVVPLLPILVITFLIWIVIRSFSHRAVPSA